MKHNNTLRRYATRACIVLLLVYIGWSIFVGNPFASNPPPGFEEKVALARAESDKLQLPYLLDEETTQLSTAKNAKVTCVRGSYSTPTTSGDGVRCEKGYVKYFGLKSFDEATIEHVNDRLKSLGWEMLDQRSYADTKHTWLTDSSRGVGMSYRNKDGLLASLSFARRDAPVEPMRHFAAV